MQVKVLILSLKSFLPTFYVCLFYLSREGDFVNAYVRYLIKTI